MEMYMVWIWLGVFLLTILLEALTQDLISIWFSLGAIVALIFSAFPISWYVQVIIFAGVSLFVMILTRPFAKKLLMNATRYTNIDEYVGKRVKVIADITKFEPGVVKINDIPYQASLLEESNEPISIGEIVEIVTFKGNKVIVKKIVRESR